jgi:general secretion pathway protein F
MPAFAYQALDTTGKTQRGVLQGDTARAVRGVLRERGLNPLSVDEVREGAAGGSGFARRGLGAAQLALLTRQLATLLGAGLPIDEALGALSEQADSERQRALTVALRARVTEGASLAQALREFPESFPDIFCATVAAGEQSGHLDSVLDKLADYAESSDALRQKVLAALAYPLLLTIVAIAVVTGLLGWVVPQIVGVFENMHQALPWPTRANRAVGVRAALGLAARAACGRRRRRAALGAATGSDSLSLARDIVAPAARRPARARSQHGARDAHARAARRQRGAVARRAWHRRAGCAESADA